MERPSHQEPTVGNSRRDSVAVTLDEEAATAIYTEVRGLVRGAFDPRRDDASVPSPGRAFLAEVMRLAREQGVELSEEDLAELIEAAVELEVAGEAATWIGDAVGGSLEGSYETFWNR